MAISFAGSAAQVATHSLLAPGDAILGNGAKLVGRSLVRVAAVCIALVEMVALGALGVLVAAFSFCLPRGLAERLEMLGSNFLNQAKSSVFEAISSSIPSELRPLSPAVREPKARSSINSAQNFLFRYRYGIGISVMVAIAVISYAWLNYKTPELPSPSLSGDTSSPDSLLSSSSLKDSNSSETPPPASVLSVENSSSVTSDAEIPDSSEIFSSYTATEPETLATSSTLSGSSEMCSSAIVTPICVPSGEPLQPLDSISLQPAITNFVESKKEVIRLFNQILKSSKKATRGGELRAFLSSSKDFTMPIFTLPTFSSTSILGNGYALYLACRAAVVVRKIKKGEPEKIGRLTRFKKFGWDPTLTRRGWGGALACGVNSLVDDVMNLPKWVWTHKTKIIIAIAVTQIAYAVLSSQITDLAIKDGVILEDQEVYLLSPCPNSLPFSSSKMTSETVYKELAAFCAHRNHQIINTKADIFWQRFLGYRDCEWINSSAEPFATYIERFDTLVAIFARKALQHPLFLSTFVRPSYS